MLSILSSVKLPVFNPICVLFCLPFGDASTERLYHQDLVSKEFINILFGLVARFFAYLHHDLFRKQSPASVSVA